MKKTFLLLLFILSFAFVGLIPVMAEGASQSEATTTVSLTAYFDNENIIEQGSVVSTFGTNDGYTISKTDFEDYSFVWWVVNGVLYDSVELTGEFMVTSDMHIVAVFKPLNTFAVVFVDTNGAIINVDYVDNTGTGDATAPSTVEYSKPGYIVNATTPWNGSTENITQDTVFTLQYVENTSDSVPTNASVTVVNGTCDGILVDDSYSYNYGDVATVTATGAVGTFQYWRIGNQVVSRSSTYKFSVLVDTTITAVYSSNLMDVDTLNITTPYINLKGDLGLRADYDTFVSQFYLPDGYTLVEYGMIASANSGILDFGLASEAYDRYVGTKYNSTTNEFLMSISESHLYTNYRAYLICRDAASNLLTYYSQGTDLFISEYSEPSTGNNKYIEIYNPTPNTVDLSGYQLKMFVNGALTATTFTLTGTLASGDVYVVSLSTADAAVLEVADLTSGSMTHNGNDAFGLFKNDILIDQFGIIGIDPGAGWVNSTDQSTANMTWIRSHEVRIPTTVWNPEEWTVSANTTEFVGDHYIDD